MKLISKEFFTLLSLIFLLAPFSFAVYSQNLDDDFLQGLPLDVQKRLEIGNEEEGDDELDKLLSTKSSIEKNEALLESLSRQLEMLRESLDITNQDSSLKRFGDSFFNDFQSTFMPINIGNMGTDYVVDVGDELVLNLLGKVSKTEKVIVARDGTISIPSLGKITVAGKTFAEVDNLFNTFLKSNALGVEGTISLSKLRDMQVLVLGYVFQPGIYTLSGGSSILGAIKAAGGIAANGSFREISHIRNGKILDTFDLYDLFINGFYKPSLQLRSGDSILINPVKKLIPISGGVNRPAIYELLDNENIEHLINFAGGVSEASIGYNFLYVKQLSDNEGIEKRLSLQDISKYDLKTRDQITIPFYSQEIQSAKQVTIKGWVQRPGSYFIKDGDTFEDLLRMAGGYKTGSYSYGISLFREEAKALENEIMLLEYQKSVDHLVSVIGRPGAPTTSALGLLEEGLRARSPIGRVVNNFVLNPTISLSDGDEIVVPKLQKIVYLFGEFNKASNAFYEESFNVKDYIEIGGGLTKNSTGFVVVIDPDGRSSLYDQRRFFSLLSWDEVDIHPGSIIYAPKDIGGLSGIQYASTVAPIVSSLALSLASLYSISDS